jgi:3-hydroxyisobutyrate dehydrogenase
MAVQMAGLSEALALGAAMGLDPGKLTSVINSSSGRCWASDTYNPVPVRV